jgi:filamentous hemagglutinin family protein
MNTQQSIGKHQQAGATLFRPSRMIICLAAIGFVPPLAIAAPEGGVVRAGGAQIAQQGNTTRIDQSSQRAVLDWRNFSINADERVQFAQPSASSATLNRVTGDQISLILGRLDANGQVLLINPNGIVFGSGAQINVGSLIASTSNIGNDNFMEGRLIFDQPGKPGAGIVNAGSITAKEGGLVALVAPHVRNDGLIQAHLGKVTMAAADTFTIDLYGDGLINFALSDTHVGQLRSADGESVTALINQAGTIDIGGGQAVLVTAATAAGVLDNLINMRGTILADSAIQDGGRILLMGQGGKVEVSGTLSAQGVQGGDIEVLGETVHLADGAKLDVSGEQGGGLLHVGGAFQGGGTTYRAQTTLVDAGATLQASALSQGDGGEVIVWSDGFTQYAGSIEAKGGVQSGDGGKVEVSGKNTLSFNGMVDASALNGANGSLLLDPTTMNIGLAEASLINKVLRTGTSTTVTASDDINVNSPIDGRGRYAGGGLTLSAGDDINVNQYIATNNGNINLYAAAGTVNVASGAVVYAGTAPITVRSGATLFNAPYLTSGTLSLISTAGSVNIDTAIESAIGNLMINAFDDVDINQPIVSLNDGNSVSVTAGGDIHVDAQVDGRPAANTNSNGTVNMTAGQDINLNKSILANNIDLSATAGTINAPTMTAGTVTLDADGIPQGEGLFAGTGSISVTAGGNFSTGIYVTTGPVSLRSTNGNVNVDTKIAEVLGDVTIMADAGAVNVAQEIANIRSGRDLSISAGTNINLNRQIDALDDSNPLSIAPVAGGSVTFVAGQDVNLNRDLATFNGPVDITATAGTVNIAWNAGEDRTYRINSGSAPISVTTGADFSTGTAIPAATTFPDYTASELPLDDRTPAILAYIAAQLKPWVSLVTTGKLTLTSTSGDVIVDAPIPDTTGEVEINAGDAIVINSKLLSNNQDITLNAGVGGITVNSTSDDYGLSAVIGGYASIYPGTGDLTLNSVGDVWINTDNGIDTAGKFTIDTRAKILQGELTLSNPPIVPSEVVLIADQGIDNFYVGYSPKVTATSSNGSIRLSVSSPNQLDINAAVDVYTGGELGNAPTIHAGNDINLTDVIFSGNVVLDAGRDANLNSFLHVMSLDITAGRDVNFNAVVPLDPSTPTIWMDGGNIQVVSTGRDINFDNGSAVHLDGTASLDLSAYGSVTFYKLETKGPVSITASTGNINLMNDIGPFIVNPTDTADPNDYDQPADDVPLFDLSGEGPESLALTATLGDINMQGAQAVNDIFITSGDVLTAAHEIYSNRGDLVINAQGGAWEPLIAGDQFRAGPYIQDSRSGGNYWFGNKSIGTQVQLDEPNPFSPISAPGPSVSAPSGPGALTALPAQAPSLAGVGGTGIPGVSGSGGFEAEGSTTTVDNGSGTWDEIIPEGSEGVVIAGNSTSGEEQAVFSGGRGVAQYADLGNTNGMTGAPDVFAGSSASSEACDKGEQSAKCN